MTNNFIFKCVDSHWVCINVFDEKRLLCDFLRDYGFDYLPDYIKYCLCENDTYSMKYRVHGGIIDIFINKL